jgi:hypothetical protein
VGWLGFATTLLYAVNFILRIAPSILFKQILAASAWCDWARVRRCSTWARVLRHMAGGVGVPERELLIREAYALAFEGHVDEAVRWMEERVKPRATFVESSYLARLSSVYEYARQFDRQVDCLRRAQASGNGGATGWIDLAGALLRRGRDLAGGRAALERARPQEMSEMAKGFLALYDAVAALLENDAARAEHLLREALPYFQTGTALMEVLERVAEGYLCIACARQGKRDEAVQLWRRAQPMLEARREIELLRECRAALGLPAQA